MPISVLGGVAQVMGEQMVGILVLRHNPSFSGWEHQKSCWVESVLRWRSEEQPHIAGSPWRTFLPQTCSCPFCVVTCWQLFGFSVCGFAECYQLGGFWLREAKTLFLGTLPSAAMPLGSAVEILATDDPDFAQEEEQELQVYEKHDDLLHGPNRRK